MAQFTVVTPAGASGFLTRVAGLGISGGSGFDILVDNDLTGADRAIELHTFDATGSRIAQRRVATLCASTNEENLPFTQSGLRFGAWDQGASAELVAF